jgi:hypothetical protein
MIIALGVCCVGDVIGGRLLWLLNRADNAVGAVRSAAVDYLDAGRAGDLDRAYQMLCAATRRRTSREAFGATSTPLRSYTVVGVRVDNVNGRDRGFVATRLTLADDTSTDQIIPFAYEGGRWRPCAPEDLSLGRAAQVSAGI